MDSRDKQKTASNSKSDRKVVIEKRIKGRFAKGNSGNPKGRPKGSRNRAALLKDALFSAVDKEEPDVMRLYKKAYEMAMSGHFSMMRTLLDPCLQFLREEAPIAETLEISNDPETRNAELIEAMMSGQISIEKGAKLIQSFKTDAEMSEQRLLAQRIENIEKLLMKGV